MGQPSGFQGSVSVWPRNREDRERELNGDEEIKEGDQVGEGEVGQERPEKQSSRKLLVDFFFLDG